MTEPTGPPPKGGRPRLEVPGIRVSTWVSAPDYDRLLDLANRHEKSLSGVIRELLKLKLPSDV